MPTRIPLEQESKISESTISEGKLKNLNGQKSQTIQSIPSKETIMSTNQELTTETPSSVDPNGSKKKKIITPSRVLKANIKESFDVPSDTVSVSEDLFIDLSGPSYVTIQCLTNELQGIPWTLFRCELDPSLNPNTCAIRSSITNISPSSNSSQTTRLIQIANANPVHITHAIVSVDAEFYHQHQSDPNNGILLTQLGQSHIIRQGELHPEVDGGCRIRICEPVDQGLFNADKIKLTVVCDDHFSNDLAPSSTPSQLPNNAHISDLHTNESAVSLESEDSLDVEISKFLDIDDEDDDDTSVNLPSITVSVSVIQKPIFIDTLIPTPEPFDDMEIAAYVRIELLARLGCLSGDIVCHHPISLTLVTGLCPDLSRSARITNNS